MINHTAQCRSINLSAADREDLAAEVFLAIVDNDMAVLRHFRGKSSLATYLTVIARRVVVRKLVERPLGRAAGRHGGPGRSRGGRPRNSGSATTKKSAGCLGELHGSEAAVVRMYHLEGKTYQEISRTRRHARKQRRADAQPGPGQAPPPGGRRSGRDVALGRRYDEPSRAARRTSCADR